MEEQTYYIYKLTFPNGKQYIGQTCQKPEQRWQSGEGYKNQEMYVDIVLYGWDNIQKEILHEGLSLEQANKLEKYYINKFNTIKNGYNKNTGGQNFAAQRKTINVNLEYNAYSLIHQHIPFLVKNLRESAFRLFLYFLKFNKSTVVFSPKTIAVDAGICQRSISTGFQELIEKGFIIKHTETDYELKFNNK